MPIKTLLPVANENPWTGWGGDPVSSATNTGHAMTTVTADDVNPGSQNKPCQWGNFPALPAGAISARLKANWQYQNASHSNPDSSNYFELSYSLVGELEAGGLGSRVIAFSVTNASGGSSGSIDVGLSLSQNMANLYVMDVIQAIQFTPGFTAVMEALVSNIRVEVLLPGGVGVMW